MSDTFYRERAARRNRQIILGIVAVAIVGCIFFSIFNLFRDDCTGSFDRSPEAIIQSFFQAVQTGDVETAVRCWEHNVYYEIDAGCSEICLSRLYGTPLNLIDISLEEPFPTESGRTNLKATIIVNCQGQEGEQTGEILLDTVGSTLPWRHWKIIHSTFGGTVAEAWCQS